MKHTLRYVVPVAAIVAAAGAGLWAGQTGLLQLPLGERLNVAKSTTPEPTGPIIYYRDPDGKPLFSDTPKTTETGKAYLPVREGEDVSFNTSPAMPAGERRIKFYRNPMGLPDTSPTPKKDQMGMDYIPVYEGEDSDDGSIKVSLGKIQRTGVETAIVGKHPITRLIQAPGIVAVDERRVAVVSPKFDGYVVKVGNVTTGTHVKEGDTLATVFGQAVLDQAARLLIEQNSGWTRSDEATSPPGLKGPAGVVGATRRLQNLGVPEEFMDQVKNERSVPDAFAIRAPISLSLIHI